MVPAERPSDESDGPNGEESDPSLSDESTELKVDVVAPDESTPTTEEAIAALADRTVARIHDLVEYLEAEREAAKRPPNDAASELLDEARALREEIRAEIGGGDGDPDASVEDDETAEVDETEERTAVTREEVESELQQLKEALATEAERFGRASGSLEDGSPEDGSPEDISPEDGSPEERFPEEGSSERGSAEDESADPDNADATRDD